jgi:hypothetical protein
MRHPRLSPTSGGWHQASLQAEANGRPDWARARTGLSQIAFVKNLTPKVTRDDASIETMLLPRLADALADGEFRPAASTNFYLIAGNPACTSSRTIRLRRCD